MIRLCNKTFNQQKKKKRDIVEKEGKIYNKMVVLDATALGGALLGGPYAQGAPQLKLVQKRYLGIHHWLSPVATKDLKEQIVSKITDH